MLRVCPTSCGLCNPECKDLLEDCAVWGSAGECNENPEFMIRNCPVTCEACKSTCRDFQADCPGWTADGECFKNPGFMYKECPNSCGVCEGVKCADGNSTQCQIWADAGECLNNPLAVMKECPDSCGVRRLVLPAMLVSSNRRRKVTHTILHLNPWYWPSLAYPLKISRPKRCQLFVPRANDAGLLDGVYGSR